MGPSMWSGRRIGFDRGQGNGPVTTRGITGALVCGTTIQGSVTMTKARPPPRVINGKRLVQSATDIFVGWGSLHGRDYYVRQFRDMKIIPSIELVGPRLADSRPVR